MREALGSIPSVSMHFAFAMFICRQCSLHGKYATRVFLNYITLIQSPSCIVMRACVRPTVRAHTRARGIVCVCLFVCLCVCGCDRVIV